MLLERVDRGEGAHLLESGGSIDETGSMGGRMIKVIALGRQNKRSVCGGCTVVLGAITFIAGIILLNIKDPSDPDQTKGQIAAYTGGFVMLGGCCLFAMPEHSQTL